MTDEAAQNTTPEEPSAETPAEAAPAVEEATPAVETAPVIAEVPTPAAEPVVEAKTSLPPDAQGWWRGTGRRKAAVARVRIKPGDGNFTVNDKAMTEFFNEERDRNDLQNVLEKTNMGGALDIHVSVKGGGYTGQAGAIILGLGRAIRNYDVGLEPTLRVNGYLTRDPRKVERKKPGQPGARKRFQFSKR